MQKARFLLAGALMLCAGGATAAEDVMVVFDGSNSMWGQIDGTAKIEIARNAMGSLIGDWTQDSNVGLMAYGHRREGDCSDIETLIAPGPFDRDAFMAKVASMSPKGKTPLASAVEKAAEALAYRDNPATIVLITDGIESCRRDPCALAGELAQMGVNFTAHVVGFDLSGEDQAAVACLAERTGGRFVAAGNAAELGAALSEVATAVAAPKPGSAPAPKPEPTSSVTLKTPESVVTGAAFDVSWETTDQQPRDFVTIVPMGAKEGGYGNYARVGDDSEGSLRAAAETGLYEVRYVIEEGRATAASAEIQVVAAETSVDAAESAMAGENFAVSWSHAVHPRDFVTIVPMGAAEGEYGAHKRVGDQAEATLTAPAEPGLYEVRYVLDEGRRTLASAEIEILEAEASVRAPQSAVVGSLFPVQWSRSIHPRDFVTIVPMGAEEGAYDSYARVGDKTEGTLTAPAAAGLYEVRYVLEEGRRTLASAEIEIVEADIELSGPDTVRAGTDIRMAWSGTPPHTRDYVTIVPMGSEEGANGDYVRVGGSSEADLPAPGQTGLYEVRYVLAEGKRTLARHTLEVVEENAPLNDGGSLQAPQSGAPGETVQVGWSADGDGDRRIALARADQADFTWIDAKKAAEAALSFTLPDEPGFYEFRLLDIGERKVLSRVTVSVE
ncbi:vWA domain-containing protein [Afifella pfennigii]|uniref:vWA domain-containing protein n=1 Tax=Afifella pfennigii TaxID=209897 RepID=UPI00047C19B3|nr:VWA domain-containing protein [Afifella pfennigii]